MYEARAARCGSPASSALTGLAAAAHFGGEHQVLLATVAFFPVLFLLGLAMPERPEVPLTDGMAITLLGTLWIGLALAHAILLRELPHGDGIVIDVLVGTFLGDTAAYLGGRAFGTRPLAPRDLAEQDASRGSRSASSGAALAVWCVGLYQDWLGGVEGARCSALVVGVARAARRPVRVQDQARRGHEGRRHAVRRPRRRARPARRGAVHARRPGTTSGCAAVTSDQTRTSSRDRRPRQEERKRDRQMIELLNELRVALPGVQILFAFLLTVPFSLRFDDAHRVPARRLLRHADRHRCSRRRA